MCRKVLKGFVIVYALLCCAGVLCASETGKTVYIPRLLSMDSTYDIAQYDYFRDVDQTETVFKTNKSIKQSSAENVQSHSLKKQSVQGNLSDPSVRIASQFCELRCSMQVTPIYLQSQPSSSLGKVFLFNKQKQVLVTQAGGAGTVYANNIYSEWLGLNASPAQFQQSFSWPFS